MKSHMFPSKAAVGVLILGATSLAANAGDLTANAVTIANSGSTAPILTLSTASPFASSSGTLAFIGDSASSYDYTLWDHSSASRYLIHRWRTGHSTYTSPVLMDLFGGGSTAEAAQLTLYKLDNSSVTTQTKGVNLNAGGNSWFKGGNLGIGTDSPAYLLELKASSAPTLRINEDGVNPQAAFRVLASRNTGNSQNYLQLHSESTSVTGHFVFSAGGGYGSAYIAQFEGNGSTSDHGRLNMYRADDQSNTLRLTSGGDSFLNGGNVGVGTSSPSEKLEVSGKFKLSDALKLTPRTSAPSSPSAGDIYCKNTSGVYTLHFYDGSTWKTVVLQ